MAELELKSVITKILNDELRCSKDYYSNNYSIYGIDRAAEKIARYKTISEEKLDEKNEEIRKLLENKGMLEAKVYAYEAIISNSNFKAAIKGVKEKK